MDIAILTARGGSKRVPRKNMRPFAGRPMLAWPLRAALDSGLFEHVVVSTEDEEIAAIARECGAEVPFLRPAELAGDFIGTCEVLTHALRCLDYGPVKRCCCLYGTSYAVTPELLARARHTLDNEEAQLVLAAKAYTHPIERALAVGEDGLVRYRQPEFFKSRTQDLPTSYHDVGLFYYFDAEAFLSLPVPDFAPLAKRLFVMPELSLVDIDNEDDFQTAETLFRLQSADDLGSPLRSSSVPAVSLPPQKISG